MTIKQAIYTLEAPQPIGTYSQGIRVGNVVYLSGQVPRTLDTQDRALQAHEIFDHLEHIAKAAGGGLSDFVRISIYLTDLKDFPVMNQVMETRFSKPYPARSTIQVSALPKGAPMEVDAIMVLPV